MKKISPFKIVLLISLILFGFSWISPPSNGEVIAENLQQDGPEVDPELLEQFTRSDSVDYFIYFEAKADLSPAYGMSWEERGLFVYDRLTDVANASQKAHDSSRLRPWSASFWTSNQSPPPGYPPTGMT